LSYIAAKDLGRSTGYGTKNLDTQGAALKGGVTRTLKPGEFDKE